jgi:peptidylprolyl isomerase
VNQIFKRYRWLLAAIILTLGLAACGPQQASPEATTVETEVVATEEEVEETGEEVVTEEADQASESAEGGGELDGLPTPTMETITLEDATVTDSGLQYLEVSAGEGATPQEDDIMLMHVVASLPDGTEILNTYQQEEPIMAIFGREQLLPGWEEGLSMMNVGGEAKLILPPELAFGEQGYGSIPPNSQLVMEIELVSIEETPVPAEVAEDEMTTTEEGLQYYDLEEGEGEKAEATHTVVTDYTIWVQGEEEAKYIGSSEYTQPATFVIGRESVFAGWEQGVTGMRPGGKRLLIIPPDLAFGDQATGQIPADATLIMEVELNDITVPPKPTDVDEDEYTVTEEGLKYYDIVEGEGETPEAGQTVVVHYTGWLEDGSVFDSSLQRGQPFALVLGEGKVIDGWEQGLKTMKVGGKRQLVIPPELGYGEQGAGNIIPPNATLTFEIELIEIQEGE